MFTFQEGHVIGLQLRATARPNIVRALGQSIEEGVQFSPHATGRAPAGIGRHLRACPLPDRLIGIVVRAVGGQRHQPQAQVRGGELGAQLLATVSWRVVPDHDQRLGVGGT